MLIGSTNNKIHRYLIFAVIFLSPVFLTIYHGAYWRPQTHSLSLLVYLLVSIYILIKYRLSTEINLDYEEGYNFTLNIESFEKVSKINYQFILCLIVIIGLSLIKNISQFLAYFGDRFLNSDLIDLEISDKAYMYIYSLHSYVTIPIFLYLIYLLDNHKSIKVLLAIFCFYVTYCVAGFNELLPSILTPQVHNFIYLLIMGYIYLRLGNAGKYASNMTTLGYFLLTYFIPFVFFSNSILGYFFMMDFSGTMGPILFNVSLLLTEVSNLVVIGYLLLLASDSYLFKKFLKVNP